MIDLNNFKHVEPKNNQNVNQYRLYIGQNRNTLTGNKKLSSLLKPYAITKFIPNNEIDFFDEQKPQQELINYVDLATYDDMVLLKLGGPYILKYSDYSVHLNKAALIKALCEKMHFSGKTALIGQVQMLHNRPCLIFKKEKNND